MKELILNVILVLLSILYLVVIGVISIFNLYQLTNNHLAIGLLALFILHHYKE